MQRISINDLLSIINSIKIIDIRSIQSFNNNHIPNSVNIPVEKLLYNPEQYINKNDIYYIYCQKGISSYNVCNILNKLGYRTISIDGGYEAWILKN